MRALVTGAGLNGALGLYEGAFASAPQFINIQPTGPFRSAAAGPTAWRSSTPGTVQGRFGWGDPSTGLVNNTRVTAADVAGVVIPFRSINGFNGGVVGGPAWLGGWQARLTWEFFDPSVTPAGGLRVRPGLVVTLMDRGNFWLRFAGGAIAGQPVYASLADGSAISGEASNAEQTPFTVCFTTEPGQLSQVSTSAFFTP